jgi:leucine dehydrogenase
MAMIIKDIATDGYERIVRVINESAKLDCIIAVHNIRLGPSLGGVRFWAFDNIEQQLTDAKRLAEGMTYKNSICGINFGGGKAVINANYCNGEKTPELYKAFGEVVHELGGIYVTAGDVGTLQTDLLNIKETTEFVGGIEIESSIPTAIGVFNAMKATSAYMRDDDMNFDGMHFCISGVGKVGGTLARLLFNDGARITVADVNATAIENLTDILFDTIDINSAHTVKCDYFSPCALGNVLNAETRSNLNCSAIVGAANNQLDNEETDQWLFNNKIVYAPDYLVNSGGVISIAAEIENTEDNIDKALDEIANKTFEVIQSSNETGVPTDKISKELAWERINKG